MTAHIGGAAYLYHGRAFGNPVTTWNVPAGNLGHGIEDLQSAGRLENEPSMADVIAWVAERARIFRDAVAEIDDAVLGDLRPSHIGDPKPIRWFVGVMIQHYSYHAGEINHIRALHQGDDA